MIQNHIKQKKIQEIDDVVLTNFAACGAALSNDAKKQKCLKIIETAAQKNETLQEEDVIFEFFSNWALLSMSIPNKNGNNLETDKNVEKKILTAFEKCEKLLEEGLFSSFLSFCVPSFLNIFFFFFPNFPT